MNQLLVTHRLSSSAHSRDVCCSVWCSEPSGHSCRTALRSHTHLYAGLLNSGQSDRHRNVKINNTRTGEIGRLLNKVINFRPRFKKISRLFRFVSNSTPPPDRPCPALGPRYAMNSSCCALLLAVPAGWRKMARKREGVQQQSWIVCDVTYFHTFYRASCANFLFSFTARSRVPDHAAV
jgi:hypothetical protein